MLLRSIWYFLVFFSLILCVSVFILLLTAANILFCFVFCFVCVCVFFFTKRPLCTSDGDFHRH